MNRSLADSVFDIGRDLQNAYDEGYRQGRYDEKAEGERKTGKWIKKDCDLLYCSECDLPSLHPWPYCERCGAKMDF